MVACSFPARWDGRSSQSFDQFKCLTLVPPGGHERVLEAITYISGQLKRNPRFLPIVNALMANIDNDVLTLACLRLFNSIVNRPDDLDTRLHLRNEFMRAFAIASS